MRAKSIALTSLLCVTSTAAVYGVLLRSQELDDADLIANVDDIDVQVAVQPEAPRASLTWISMSLDAVASRSCTSARASSSWSRPSRCPAFTRSPGRTRQSSRTP